jgi:Zn-dependent protease with chaperone function
MRNKINSPLSKIFPAIIIATISLGLSFVKPVKAEPTDSFLKHRKRAAVALHQIVGDDSRAMLGFTPRIAIIKSQIPNAYATGQEYIVISSGLMELLQSKEELQFVLAHELAHLILGHTASKQSRALLNNSEEYQQQELAADKEAIRLLSQAGINSAAAATALERISKESISSSILTQQEISGIKQRIASLGE